MNISLTSYNAVYDFLKEIDPILGEKLANSSDGEYDYILEELNIRKRGQVTIDSNIFKGREEELYLKAKKNLEEWDEEEYISYIDQDLIDRYQLSYEFFYDLIKK